MSSFLGALRVIDFIAGGLVKETGGSTRCNHTGCDFRIKNEEYEDFKSTNKACTVCKHPYYDHDIFAW